MKYSTVVNPVWADPDHRQINCTVTFDGLGTVPFSASPNDVADHGREIYADCVAGQYGPIAEFVAEVPVVTIITAQQPTVITPLQFINRFTDAEQLAIVTATMQSPVVKLWYDKLLAAQSVEFADPRVASGLDSLVAAGLLTQDRALEILPMSVRSQGTTVL
jgi:hypothetical protein